MANDRYWFKHDYEAGSDEKLEELIEQYGAIGYGVYWWVVERLHKENNSIELTERFFKSVSRKMKQKLEKIKQLLNEMVEDFNLFEVDNNFLFANRVQKNLNEKNGVSQIRSVAGKKGVEKKQLLKISKQNLANGKQSQANGKQNLADKIRVEESREDKKDIQDSTYTAEVGSERVAEAANEAWTDQKWKESICIGCTLKSESELKKWMAQFNSSVSNDSIPGFDKNKYKKIFRGWLLSQQEKGRSVELTPPSGNGLNGQLKNINNLT
jgi:hypothetical protein